MTTANAVLTSTLKNALSVPLEAISISDEVTYLFKREGGKTIRQEVITGIMNDDEIVVLKGVKEGDDVLLTPPTTLEGVETRRLPGSRPASTDTSKSVPVTGDSVTPISVPAATPDTKAAAAPATTKATQPATKTTSPAPAVPKS
jgi:hypothetical protein